MSVKFSIATRWFIRQNQKGTTKCTHTHTHTHACTDTQRHTRSCFSGYDRCRMDSCILSSKGGPRGSLLSDSTPGISCYTVTPIPSCHTQCCPKTTVCVCVCVVGFHHVRYTTADLFVSVVWHCLVHLYAPSQWNLSATLLSIYFLLLQNENFQN